MVLFLTTISVIACLSLTPAFKTNALVKGFNSS